MDFGLDFINGASVGFEYSKGQSEEEYENTFLIDLFITPVISWFRPHVTGRGNSHEIWHNLAMFHVLGSVLFPVTIIFHMATHWD